MPPRAVSRLLLVLAVVLAATPRAAAQAGWPELRLVDRDPDGATFEVEAAWTAPLRALDQRDALRFALEAVHGAALVSAPVDLPTRSTPSVTILEAEADEVPLALDPADAEALGLVGPLAEVVHVGLERRRPTGTLAVRLLQADPAAGVLRRVHRLRVRVDLRAAARVEPPAARFERQAEGERSPHLAVRRSVLAEGRWFRVAVPRGAEGIYRIDRAFLAALGVDPARTDPASVRVYANGGAPLPALNRAPRPVDLLPVATVALGGGDGRFDEGDAVVFHAHGPEGWRWNPDEAAAGRPGWEHFINPFSAVHYYYIRVDGAPAPPLSTAPLPVGPPRRLQEVEGRLFVEEDLPTGMVNRDGGGSGLDWLGRSVTPSAPVVTVLPDTLPPGFTGGLVRYRVRAAAASQAAVTLAFQRGGTTLAGLALPRLSGSTLFHAGVRIFEETLPAAQPLRLEMRLSGGGNPTGWIDYVQAFYRQTLRAEGDYLRFATPGGQAGDFAFVLTGFSGPPEVWDVTEPGATRRVAVEPDGNAFVARLRVEDPDRPRELVAFRPRGPRVRTLRADRAEPVPNQNLRGITGYPDYVIVTPAAFRPQAERLAARRAADGLTPLVVEIEQIFHEFAGGLRDPRGLRDYLRFLYDRGPGDDPALRLVLLFGGGHYDYRGIKDPDAPNWVPPWQSDNSSDNILSYTSDDYFGLLDPDEGLWPFTAAGEAERLDVGIGRLPVYSVADAEAVLRKIERYEDPATHGAWRLRYTLLADDHRPNVWDTDLHVQNAEVVGAVAREAAPELSFQKVYMPMFPLQQTALGARYPAATEAALRALEEGTLLWNYSGHGSPFTLADERLVTREQIAALGNLDRLTIAITATCSFGRFDLVDERSGGETFLLNPDGGAVALFTTNRIVYASPSPALNNLGLNVTLNRELLRRDPDGRPRRLGEAYLATKRSAVGAQRNNRKFNLLGDPALRIGLPELPLRVTAVNGTPLDAEGPAPELRALERAEIEGEVLTPDGRPDPAFQGEVEVEVYDVERTEVLPAEVPRLYTDGTFRQRTDLLWRGRASVRDGRWRAAFVVPRDVSYSGGTARIAAYATGGGRDGAGFTEAVRVSTAPGAALDDREGPRIRLFLNDTTFVPGGLVGPNPLLIARLYDESGINVGGTGVGHELRLVLNGREAEAVDLGPFYRSDLDTFRSGTVRYPLRDLPEGPNRLALTAWDVANNASTATLDFVVAASERLRIAHAYPYPNPTPGPTRFVFEHNQPPGTPARVQIRIYTLAGRPVRTLDGPETLPGGALTSATVHVPWDGCDEDGAPLASGIYLYRVRVEAEAPDGARRVAERVERLAVIR